jgi:hypothetical protein
LGGVLLWAAVPVLDAQKCVVEVPEWAPRGSASNARPRITATLVSSCGAAIEVSSIRMTVNDEAVEPATDGSGATVTVAYVPEKALLEEADHTVVVRARDANGAAGERTWTFRLPDTYTR